MVVKMRKEGRREVKGRERTRREEEKEMKKRGELKVCELLFGISEREREREGERIFLDSLAFFLFLPGQ